MDDLAGQDVLVLGLGRSGRSAARFCAEHGARVTAADERSAASLAGDLPGDCELVLGRAFPDAADFDLVVPSPGVPPARYAERARRVWGEMELAGRALSVPIAAVTGTNGKSTVTTLLAAMLRAAGLRAEAAGNLGQPALELVGRPLDVAVLEVSSFQLETSESFRPAVAVVLNLTPDHLDRHGSFEAYAEAKARILDHQQPEDAAVLNADDAAVWALAERARGRVFATSTRGMPDPGAGFDTGQIVLRDGETRIGVPLPPGSCLARGLHNVQNVLAATCAVHALGADVAKAARALDGFEGLPHRLERVRELDGVTFVNDSKATNVDAARRALESFAAPILWIAGGRDKGGDFAELAASARGRVRTALLVGEASEKLERALGSDVPHERSGTLEAAVARAAQLARPGDVCLLSPACASFDQFADFEERGERFRAAVRALRPAQDPAHGSGGPV